MNKIFRRGLDLRLAIDAEIRRALGDRDNTARVDDSGSTDAAERPAKRKRGLRKRFKRALRRVTAIFGSQAGQDTVSAKELERVKLEFARELREKIAMVRVDAARSAHRSAESVRTAPTASMPAVADNRGVVVVGAGGHAKVVVELLEAMGERVAYCVARVDSDALCLHVPVLRGDENLRLLRQEGFDRVFIAVGSNRLRGELSAAAERLGFELINAISPSAVVSPSARLGRGIAIMANAVVNAGAVVEDLVIVNSGATVDHDCHIGERAHIAPQCGLAGNVRVGAGSLLGIGCSVIPGISIGSEVTIGAGSVVIRDVPDGVTVVGVPAHRPHGNREATA